MIEFWRNLSIRIKLVLGFTSVAVVAILLTASIAFYQANKELTQQTQGNLIALTQVKSQHLNEFFKRMETRAIDFSSDGFIRDATSQLLTSSVDEDQPEPQTILEELNTHLRLNKQSLSDTVIEIHITDKSGTVLASTVSEAIGSTTSLVELNDIRHLMYGQALISDIQPHETILGEVVTLTATASLTDKVTGDHLGFLINVIDPEELGEVVAIDDATDEEDVDWHRQWDQVDLFLVNAQGSVVTNTRYNDKVDVNLRVNLEEIDRCQNGYREGRYRNYLNQLVLGVAKCLENGTHLVAEVPEQTIQETAKNIFSMILVMSMIATVLIILLSLIPSQAILYPIKKIQEAAERVAQGDFSVHAPHKNKDELGKLGEHFNIMVEQLETADELKREFVSIVSHQLRTPLTSIRLYTNLVDETIKTKDEDQKGYFEAVYQSIDRMLHLISDLLNLSRIEGGRVRIKPVPEKIGELVDQAKNEVRLLASQRKVEIGTHPIPTINPIPIDRQVFTQVLHNLLTNAIKYSPEAGGTVEVFVSREQSQKEAWIHIAVKDHGIGIPLEHQPRIFEKFFRTEKARHTATEGTGVGLYVAKLLMQAAGGDIWFDSEEGKGATFHIKIPESGMKPSLGTQLTKMHKQEYDQAKDDLNH